jgi:hypothetical protein
VKPFPQGVHSGAVAAEAVMVRIAVGSGCKPPSSRRLETMTIDRMTLKALVEKSSDDDLLREMMGYVANCMILGGGEPDRRHPRRAIGFPHQAIAPGRHGSALLNLRSRSSGRAAASRPSSSRGGPRRKH